MFQAAMFMKVEAAETSLNRQTNDSTSLQHSATQS